MINLTIGKTTDTNGATLYKLTPSPVVLGNQNANAVDEVQVSGIPAEWAGLTIRAVFVPTPGAAVACILDENGRCTVSASFTGNRGEIVVDAFGEDYHAYTTPARYAVARHQDISATVDPEYTPTQVEQILSQAQTYANSAIDARDAAQGYAEDAAASAAEIEDMTVSASTLPAGSAATVTKTETQTGINLDFGIPRGADGQVQDVTIDGTSIVTDGVADIPKTSNSAWGVFKPYGSGGSGGLYADNSGVIVNKATNAQIESRDQSYRPIVPYNLDYAVKRALTDGVGTAYTDAEQAAARARIGVENATNSTWGLFKPYFGNPAYGLTIDAGGNGVMLNKATNADIDARTNSWKPVVANNLDYAVKAAMTDGRGAAWTAAEQLAGRQRLGVFPFAEWEIVADTTIPAQTITSKIDLSKACRLLFIELEFAEANAAAVNVYSGHCYNGVLNNTYRTAGCSIPTTEKTYRSIMIPCGTNAFVLHGRVNVYQYLQIAKLQANFPTAVSAYDNVMIHFYDHNNQTAAAHVVVWGM